MEKFFTALVLSLFVFAAYGQDTVMSSWPYLYPEFAGGKVILKDGKEYERELNVSVASGKLHFIDKDVIKEMESKDILLVDLNGDRFTTLNGYLVKVVGDMDGGYVAVRSSIDYQKLNETDGPYGTKVDAGATLNLTTFELVGVAASRSERNEGIALPLKDDYFLVVGGNVINASKKAVENSLDAAGKDAFKDFQKKNKIRWRDSSSLLLLVDFLNGQ